MSVENLDCIFFENCIKKRQQILSNYLKNNDKLNEYNKNIIKMLFHNNYECDYNEQKFDINQIDDVIIDRHKIYKTKMFQILVNQIYYPVSIKKLIGNKQNINLKYNIAYRNSIYDQIKNFRKMNIYDPVQICPVMKNICISYNPQVDHYETTFSQLMKDFRILHNLNKEKLTYNLENQILILEEPYYSLWNEYHLKYAKLRYVSLEGNKISHLQK